MKNPNTSWQAFYKNARHDFFLFFTSNFFNTFEKIRKAAYIFAYLPPSPINRDHKMTFDHFFYVEKLVV